MPSPLSRGDYDIRAGLPRIHALLDKHEIPATFMVPAQVADEHPDACAEIAARGRHEVGYHGYYHESVLELSREAERDLMQRAIARLEDTFETTPRGNRSPPFALGPHTAELLEAFGFEYDSRRTSRSHANGVRSKRSRALGNRRHASTEASRARRG
jgi:peptidoglycan/xylan/chitin deacetylase (PgdA/CDA1 family)